MTDLLISVGGCVKALGDGRLAGLLIPFGNPETLDLEGEFFDARTDYGLDFPVKTNLYYHHGMDKALGRSPLGRAALKLDEAGVWFEAQLDLSERYHRKIYELAERGLLGASSGSAPHVVVKEPAAKGVYIKAWPIADASVTVTPANPLTVGRTVPLKAITVPDLDSLLGGRPSLAEQTERWLDTGGDLLTGYRQVAGAEVKIGRKLSAARRRRLEDMRDLLSEMLAETAPDTGSPETGADPPAQSAGDIDPQALLNRQRDALSLRFREALSLGG